jgi:hypothetical protein
MKTNDPKEAMMKPDLRIAVVDAVSNVEESHQPFGKRWQQEEIILDAGHLDALRQGKHLALDVQGEYVVFLKLDLSAEVVPQK